MHIKHKALDLKRERKRFEAMDLFLKFMAKRGITINYSDTAETAYYNLEENVITLPSYVLNDTDLFIRFGTHEAAHSLYTPKFFYAEHNNTSDKTKSNKRHVMIGTKSFELNSMMFSCINIVEDIRIEKLIRQDFPGLIGPYRRSAKPLSEIPQWKMLKDVASSQREFDKLTIADKINLKSKFKEFLVNVDMSDKEYAILKYLSKSKSFDDVLHRALYLYKLTTMDAKTFNNMSMKELANLLNDAELSGLDGLDALDKQDILNMSDSDDDGNGSSSSEGEQQPTTEELLDEMSKESKNSDQKDNPISSDSDAGDTKDNKHSSNSPGYQNAREGSMHDYLHNRRGYMKSIKKLDFL